MGSASVRLVYSGTLGRQACAVQNTSNCTECAQLLLYAQCAQGTCFLELQFIMYHIASNGYTGLLSDVTRIKWTRCVVHKIVDLLQLWLLFCVEEFLVSVNPIAIVKSYTVIREIFVWQKMFVLKYFRGQPWPMKYFNNEKITHTEFSLDQPFPALPLRQNCSCYHGGIQTRRLYSWIRGYHLYIRKYGRQLMQKKCHVKGPLLAMANCLLKIPLYQEVHSQA